MTYHLYSFHAGECRTNGPCQHLCFDLHDGTFECACKEDYTLANNGYSCIGKSSFSLSFHHPKQYYSADSNAENTYAKTTQLISLQNLFILS